MSRLTEEMLCACDGCELHYDCNDGTYSECEKRKFYEKVQYYEDLEEQGYKMIDVDKVVEQLKNEKEIVKSLITPRGGKAFYEGTIRGLNKAIKIVEGGTK